MLQQRAIKMFLCLQHCYKGISLTVSWTDLILDFPWVSMVGIRRSEQSFAAQGCVSGQVLWQQSAEVVLSFFFRVVQPEESWPYPGSGYPFTLTWFSCPS